MSISPSNFVSLAILPNTPLPLPGYQTWLAGNPDWILATFQPPTQLDYFYDIKGAAKLAKVSPKTIKRAIQVGQLKAGSFNKPIRIRLEDLLVWMGY